VRDFPVVPEKGGNLPHKGNVQHTIVGKGMFHEEINHPRVRVVSERVLFDTHLLLNSRVNPNTFCSMSCNSDDLISWTAVGGVDFPTELMARSLK
jgi:hypothetical protein